MIIVPPDYSLYMRCSTAMGDILREYSPVVEQYSVDEYFMDFSGMGRLYSDPIAAAHLIKNRIKNELGFTVNVGVSSNKLLAKMASELEKPDKVHTLFPEEIPDKLWPLAVDELFMVGRATSKKLYDRSVRTIGDLAASDPKWLELFLKSHGRLIWNYANGRDVSLVRTNRHPVVKSMGNSTTVPFDVDNRREAYLVLLSLVETVAARIRAAGYCCRLVSVSIKSNEFYHCSHQRKLYDPTDSTNYIHRTACELFDELWQGQPLRHLGVSAAELCASDFLQLALFNENNEKQQVMDKAINSIRNKHGSLAVQRRHFFTAD